MSSATITPPPQPVAPARLSAEEFARRYDGQRVEYVNGQVREVPMAGGKHGTVCNWVAYYLTAHALANGSGRVFTNDTFVSVPQRGDSERVYGADVCFVSFARLAKDADVPDGVIPVTPELVFEVRSPSDLWIDIMSKALDYLRAGVAVVVILDPKSRTASVYRGSADQEIFEADQNLVLPDVLPGFAVPVAALFA
jgi:Uma2 family endonuclease